MAAPSSGVGSSTSGVAARLRRLLTGVDAAQQVVPVVYASVAAVGRFGKTIPLFEFVHDGSTADGDDSVGDAWSIDGDASVSAARSGREEEGAGSSATTVPTAAASAASAASSAASAASAASSTVGVSKRVGSVDQGSDSSRWDAEDAGNGDEDCEDEVDELVVALRDATECVRRVWLSRVMERRDMESCSSFCTMPAASASAASTLATPTPAPAGDVGATAAIPAKTGTHLHNVARKCVFTDLMFDGDVVVTTLPAHLPFKIGLTRATAPTPLVRTQLLVIAMEIPHCDPRLTLDPVIRGKDSGSVGSDGSEPSVALSRRWCRSRVCVTVALPAALFTASAATMDAAHMYFFMLYCILSRILSRTGGGSKDRVLKVSDALVWAVGHMVDYRTDHQYSSKSEGADSMHMSSVISSESQWDDDLNPGDWAIVRYGNSGSCRAIRSILRDVLMDAWGRDVFALQRHLVIALRHQSGRPACELSIHSKTDKDVASVLCESGGCGRFDFTTVEGSLFEASFESDVMERGFERARVEDGTPFLGSSEFRALCEVCSLMFATKLHVVVGYQMAGGPEQQSRGVIQRCQRRVAEFVKTLGLLLPPELQSLVCLCVQCVPGLIVQGLLTSIPGSLGCCQDAVVVCFSGTDGGVDVQRPPPDLRRLTEHIPDSCVHDVLHRLGEVDEISDEVSDVTCTKETTHSEEIRVRKGCKWRRSTWREHPICCQVEQDLLLAFKHPCTFENVTVRSGRGSRVEIRRPVAMNGRWLQVTRLYTNWATDAHGWGAMYAGLSRDLSVGEAVHSLNKLWGYQNRRDYVFDPKVDELPSTVRAALFAMVQSRMGVRGLGSSGGGALPPNSGL